MLEINKIYQGDCLEIMPLIDDKKIDMILCDLPYGTTACKWDTIIPFEPLWKQYKRIIKDNGAIVLFGSEPFSSYLRLSNINQYKYDWIWNKVKPANIFNAKNNPLSQHENITIFSDGKIKYNPQKEGNEKRVTKIYSKSKTQNSPKYGDMRILIGKYPKTILTFSNANQNGRLHPTQKPVTLFEYLIKTYTNEGDLVLDNCIGSGTTAIACMQTNRNFIGIELEQKYCDIANRRIADFYKQECLI